MADEKHRGFYSSFQYVTLIGGQLCAIVVLLLLQQVFLTSAQLKAWGWRIPFLIGALLAIVALAMRRNLHETDHFVEARATVKRRESSHQGADALSARSDGRRRTDDGRDHRVLHLYDLHAEVPEAVSRADRQPDDICHSRVADLCPHSCSRCTARCRIVSGENLS